MEKTQIISICVIIILVVFYLIIKIYKKGLRQTALDLILEAEKSFENGNGKEKMAMVVSGLINKLPFPLNLVPYSMVETIVQRIFNEVKAILEYKGE